MTITRIESEEDVRTFFRYLVQDLKLNFHPDTTFEDYIEFDTGEPSFSEAEAKRLNAMMDQCFETIGEKVYEVGLSELAKALA